MIKKVRSHQLLKSCEQFSPINIAIVVGIDRLDGCFGLFDIDSIFSAHIFVQIVKEGHHLLCIQYSILIRVVFLKHIFDIIFEHLLLESIHGNLAIHCFLCLLKVEMSQYVKI